MAKRFIVPAPSLVGRADPLVAKAFQDLASQVQNAHARLDAIPPPPPVDYKKIASQLNASGGAPLNVQGLLGLLSSPQRASVTINSVAPGGGILNQGGTLTLINGVLNFFDTSTNPGSWVPVGAVAVFYADTHANRLALAKYNPNKISIGAAFWETDRKLLYLNLGTFGASAWKYSLGTFTTTQATIAGLALGVNDANLLLWISDYAHMLQWSGTVWGWGPGDDLRAGEGPIAREVDPSPTVGWHLYDGTAGVTYLKSDGTTGTVTLANLSGGGPTPSYLKFDAANSGPNAPIAPSFAGGAISLSTETATHSHTTNTSNTTTESVGHTHSWAVTTFAQPYLTGTAVTVPVQPTGGESANHTHPIPALTMSTEDATHTHTVTGGGGTIGTNGEPESIVRRAWFRQ